MNYHCTSQPLCIFYLNSVIVEVTFYHLNVWWHTVVYIAISIGFLKKVKIHLKNASLWMDAVLERTKEEFNHEDCMDMESEGSDYTDVSKISEVSSDKMPTDSLDDSESEYEPLEPISEVRWA